MIFTLKRQYDTIPKERRDLMNSIIGLSFTLGLGMFILIGAFFVFTIKNKTKLVEFSIGLAFGVMILLLALELIPESFEKLKDSFDGISPYMISLISIVLGIVTLKLLDLFIPDHEHHEHENHEDKDVQENLFHIGYVSSIAIILHNIIEGMAVYGTVSSSTSMGLLMSLGVGLHNIPLGMAITSTVYQTSKDKKKTLFLLLAIALSTFVGGILMFIFRGELLNNIVLGVLLSVTSGMLIYIILFELLPHIMEAKKKKNAVIGMILGALIFLISMIFE